MTVIDINTIKYSLENLGLYDTICLGKCSITKSAVFGRGFVVQSATFAHHFSTAERVICFLKETGLWK